MIAGTIATNTPTDTSPSSSGRTKIAMSGNSQQLRQTSFTASDQNYRLYNEVTSAISYLVSPTIRFAANPYNDIWYTHFLIADQLSIDVTTKAYTFVAVQDRFLHHQIVLLL